jgi:hypothetical protein
MQAAATIVTLFQSLNIQELQDSRPFDEEEGDLDELTVIAPTTTTTTTTSTLSVPQPAHPSLSTSSSSSSLKRSRSPSPTLDPNRRQRGGNRRRRLHRQKRREEAEDSSKVVDFRTLEKHVFTSEATSSPSDIEAIRLPLDRARLKAMAQRQFRLQDLTGPELGFSVEPWDGKKSKAIYDCQGRMLAVLAGQVEHPGYLKATDDAHAVLMEQGKALEEADEGKGKEKNRRGSYRFLGCGLTHGNGTTKPKNFKVKPRAQKMLDVLRSDASLRRLAGNASSVLKAWAPECHREVEEAVRKATEADGSLQKPFPGSVYPACSFNFGPNAWCYIHRDSMNLTTGYCSVQAMGRYDPKEGGHLVLWDLKKALEFPPGSTILLMSSLLFHSSLGVRPWEERSVLTQFCPEGLVRYVCSGMRTDKELSQGLEGEEKKEFLEKLREERKERRMRMVPRREM